MLRRKDKELHHWKGPSPARSHSRVDERMLDARNRNRDRKSPPPHGEREQSPYSERTVSPPHHKNRKREQDREKHKGPVPQPSSTLQS